MTVKKNYSSIRESTIRRPSGVSLSISLAKLNLKNPVLVASGTFGYGFEYEDFFPISSLGGFVLKGITMKPRKGNEPRRAVETPAGMLNSIGLENVGVEELERKILPALEKVDACVIANVAGSTLSEYVGVVRKLERHGVIRAIELNVSCPNVSEGGIHFGATAGGVHHATSIIRKVTKKTLIVKLSPNCDNILDAAKAAEDAGADAITLANTFLGMAVDIERRRPVFKNVLAGLSGPAIFPIVLGMVYRVSSRVRIPVIASGGIAKAEDAIAFMLAGASAVQIGSGIFSNPVLPVEVRDGIAAYLSRYGFRTVSEIVGFLHR